MLRRIAIGIAAIVIVVLAVVLVRSLSVEQRWTSVNPVTDIRIDKMAAARRLSESVTFATVSYDLQTPKRSRAYSISS